ncbi:MAG: glutathione S-transferase family protein [Cyanobacteria bacterium P01_A01_bin.84]
MLKFYYNPLSPMARRVWRYLLEKGIPFESVLMDLNGDQMEPEYLEINPFHHIPVIDDHGFKIIESLAILDYLEAKYPTPELLPKNIQDLGRVSMVKMVSTNELLSKVITLLFEDEESLKYSQAKKHINKVLEFLNTTLGDNSYFGGKNLSIADIVLGTDMSLLPKLKIDFHNYPQINIWFAKLMKRSVWQETELNNENFEQFKRRIQVIAKMRKRELSRQSK